MKKSCFVLLCALLALLLMSCGAAPAVPEEAAPSASAQIQSTGFKPTLPTPQPSARPVPATPPAGPVYSLFSWREAATAASERETLLKVMKRLSITELYQNLSEKIAEEQMDSFLRDMAANGIRVYDLVGAPEWAIEEGAVSLLAAVDRLAGIKARGVKVRGVVFDVEPRQLDEWDKDAEAVMQAYTDNMVKAYRYASAKGFRVIICIPASYDTFEDCLNTLIANACDGVAVMNYHRTKELERITYEAELAQKYRKTLINISELQKPGLHSLTEKNTYYGESLETLHAAWNALYDAIGYKNLQFSYHYYEPLKEFLQK